MRIAGSGGDSILKIRDHNGDWGALFVQPDGRVAVQNVTVESLSFDANILNNPEPKVVAPRCPTAIAFDLGDGFTCIGIRVKENKVKAGKGTLAMVLPDGAAQ
jgi:hypothetical protein